VSAYLDHTVTCINQADNQGQFRKTDGKLNSEQIQLASQTLLKLDNPSAEQILSFSRAINNHLPNPVDALTQNTLAALAKLDVYRSPQGVARTQHAAVDQRRQDLTDQLGPMQLELNEHQTHGGQLDQSIQDLQQQILGQKTIPKPVQSDESPVKRRVIERSFNQLSHAEQQDLIDDLAYKQQQRAQIQAQIDHLGLQMQPLQLQLGHANQQLHALQQTINTEGQKPWIIDLNAKVADVAFQPTRQGLLGDVQTDLTFMQFQTLLKPFS
jgi:hypothetical protein